MQCEPFSFPAVGRLISEDHSIWMTIDKSMINGIYSQAITWFNELKLTFAIRVVFNVIDLIGIVGKFFCIPIKP